MALPVNSSRRNGFVVRVGLVLGVCLVLLGGGVFGGLALAVPAAPSWGLTVAGVPSVLPSGLGKRGRYDVVVENVGGATAEGTVVVRDVLPAGLSIVQVHEAAPEGSCSQEGAGEVSCSFAEPVVPAGFMVEEIIYEVTGSVSGTLVNRVSVSGDGAPAVSGEDSTRVAVTPGEKGPAGIAEFGFSLTGPAGEPATQAGGHPNFLTTSVLLNNMLVESVSEPVKPVQAVKDLVFYLPLGMLGNPSVADTCPASLVETHPERTGCPPGSRIGTILPIISSNIQAGTSDPTHEHGLYSVTPEKGFPAEFAFTGNTYTFTSYASVVRRNGAYMLRIETPGVPQIAYLIGLVATFDGDITETYVNDGANVTYDRGSFLTNPTDCGEPAAAREATVAFDTWEEPNPALPYEQSVSAFSQLTGCSLLSFSAGLTLTPENTRADEPSGYEVGLEMPQAPPGGAAVLGTPPQKDVSVTLPQGTTISPSSANGLEACQETGPQGINIEDGESEVEGPDGLMHVAAGHCPQASQVATVEGTTPLLHEALQGHMFLAAPQCGGTGPGACNAEDVKDGKLFGLFLELEAPTEGVIIKLKGYASVQEGTDQVTAVFDEAPQFPVSKLVVKLKRGARAPLANPLACGPASARGVVQPWSAPQTPAAVLSSTFEVDWDGAGGRCPASLPFAPALLAGTVSSLAGSSSPFSLTLKREDREANVKSLTSTLPAGLLANLSKVARCPEPQASEASLEACPASSQVGTTTVSVGPGSEPYTVTGKVFLTGPYNGAPFGLSVVVPAVAGPFNLGDVLVRVALFINPTTLQVTAQSGVFPPELDGVPLQVRSVNVLLEKSDFTLNPTSCGPTSVTGTVYSTTGSMESVSSPFTTVGCRNLAFKPVVSAATEARSTKADGTGVSVKVVYPSNGGQANISKFVLSFPTKLPVRLSTLQQACPSATFEANPASCSPNSIVGSTTVHTPLLAAPLTGPAFLVSYGSAKFPDVVFVLQGEGIRLNVDGQSNVSSKGVLTVTIPSVPDAPFSSFESVLPAKAFSAFTSAKTTGQASASQCGEDLLAPVTMVAQNGAQITEKIKLAITGCKAPSARVSILATKAAGSGLRVKIKTSLKGSVRVAGPGLATLVKSGVSAGTHQLTVALTGAGVKARRAHRKIQLTVGLVAGKKHASKHKKIVP